MLEKFRNLENKKKNIIICIGAVIIIALAAVIIFSLVSSGSTSSKYNNATPTDENSVVGVWHLEKIVDADGKKLQAKDILGKKIDSDTDIITFAEDGSFSNTINNEGKGAADYTGSFAVLVDGQVSLTYGNGSTATAEFDKAKQTLTFNVPDADYQYVLKR